MRFVTPPADPVAPASTQAIDCRSLETWQAEACRLLTGIAEARDEQELQAAGEAFCRWAEDERL